MKLKGTPVKARKLGDLEVNGIIGRCNFQLIML
jgi:hypothetical protein